MNDTGINWAGDIDALNRLILGYPINLEAKLKEKGIEIDEVQKIMGTIRELEIPLVQPWMPMQDSIDLVEFLAQTTKNYSKYTPGPQIVGGDIDIATITRHEKFKWIKRKHFYSQEINRIIR